MTHVMLNFSEYVLTSHMANSSADTSSCGVHGEISESVQRQISAHSCREYAGNIEISNGLQLCMYYTEYIYIPLSWNDVATALMTMGMHASITCGIMIMRYICPVVS